MNEHVVTVVIPTLAEACRAVDLRRAIDSVLRQEQVSAVPLIVINGDRFDRDLRRELERRHDVRTCYQETGNLPLAIETGRRLVDSEFFSYLDDDDHYLPQGLSRRLEPMLADSGIDAVVSGGYTESPDGEIREVFPDLCEVQEDPLLRLTHRSWLASCGGLYRTVTVGEEVFAGLKQYFEWTLVAYRLILSECRIRFIDEPTFQIYESEVSLSRSDRYILAASDFYEHLVTLDFPPEVMKTLRRQCSESHNWASQALLSNGDRRAALQHHLRSLRTWYGFRSYFFYTRKLLSQ